VAVESANDDVTAEFGRFSLPESSSSKHGDHGLALIHVEVVNVGTQLLVFFYIFISRRGIA
jgi:hypothetical protein